MNSIKDVILDYFKIDWTGFECPSCGFKSRPTYCKTHNFFICLKDYNKTDNTCYIPCCQKRRKCTAKSCEVTSKSVTSESSKKTKKKQIQNRYKEIK